MNNNLTDSIILFADILGFTRMLENEKDSENLFKVIKGMKENNTSKSNIKHTVNSDVFSMTGMPTISSFSDCIVLSFPLTEIKPPFDIGNAVNALLGIVQQLADSLIYEGYILRGGMTRGELYHQDGIVFGKALIEAYELESTKAKNPRILVSNELAKEYNKHKFDKCNFLSRDNMNDTEEYYLDYLKLSFKHSDTKQRYQQKTEKIICEKKKNILKKVNCGDLNHMAEDIKILEKWIYFQKYIQLVASYS